jgi:hypothetical protein
MKTKLIRRLLVGASVAAIAALSWSHAHAAGYVDLVLGGNQGSQTFIDFRNQNFAMHVGGIEDANALPNGVNDPRYEYAIPTHYSKTKWLLDMEGERVTVVPGTDFIDYDNPTNRAAYVRAQKKWCAQIKSTRIFFDCPFETAPDFLQQMGAAFLVKDLVDAGFKVMVNDGDPYKAAERDETKPAGYVNKYATAIFIQDAIDVNQFNFSRYVLTCSVINSYVAMDKSVVVGVFDLNGKNPAAAQQFFGAAAFSNPLVYKHYNVSLLPTVNVGLEIPGGKPVVDAPVPTTIQTGLLPDLNGPVYFPLDNWWNLDMSAAPVDPNSATIIATIASYESTGGRLHPDFTPSYGIPYCVVDASTPLVPITLSNTSESDAGYPGGPTGYPIPAAATTNLRYIENAGGTDGDRHLLILDTSRKAAFELSYASYSGGRWSAGYGAVFKLDSNYRRPEGWTSTDAAGLCVLAGLVRYDEVYGTAPIRHATRCSLKKINGYVWPASHTGSTDVGGYPCGMRLRLKASVNTSVYPAPLRKLFDSWKVYGLIVADRGGNMYVQGTMDSRWDNAVLNPAFHSLHVTDFEVIQRGWKPTL